MDFLDESNTLGLLAAEILGASEFIDICVDNKGYYYGFLLGDLLNLIPESIKVRLLFAGFDDDYPIDKPGLRNRLKTHKIALTDIRYTSTSTEATMINVDGQTAFRIRNQYYNHRNNTYGKNYQVLAYDPVELKEYFEHHWEHAENFFIYKSILSIEEFEASKEIRLFTKDTLDGLISSMKSQPDKLFSISSTEFEDIIERLLQSKGCETKRTKTTRDGGIDILATINLPQVGKLLWLIECKRYAKTNPVDVRWLRAMYGIVEAEKANLRLIITTSRFTSDAKKFQSTLTNRLSLKEYEDIVSWIKEYK